MTRQAKENSTET